MQGVMNLHFYFAKPWEIRLRIPRFYSVYSLPLRPYYEGVPKVPEPVPKFTEVT